MIRIKRKKSSYIKFLELLNNPDLSKNDLILYFNLVELLGTDNKGKFKKNFLIESNEVLANADATQEEVNQAYQSLKTAYENLEERVIEGDANKFELSKSSILLRLGIFKILPNSFTALSVFSSSFTIKLICSL